MSSLLFLVVITLFALLAWLAYLATGSSTMALAFGLLLGILGRLPFDLALAAAKANGDRPKAEPQPEPKAQPPAIAQSYGFRVVDPGKEIVVVDSSTDLWYQ